MRPEQITELGQLEEQLIDLFKLECTPKKWREAVSLNDKELAMREKKVALATMQIVGRVQNSLRDVRAGGSTGDAPEKRSNAGDEHEDNGINVAKVKKRTAAMLKKHGLEIH